MAINKITRRLLDLISSEKIEVKASRNMANIKAIDPFKIFHKKMDYKIYNGEHEVPVRVFLPCQKALNSCEDEMPPVIMFIHGGGWVTDGIDSYERVCAKLAEETGHLVASVEYRLAPEHKFPTGLQDCYAVANALFKAELFPSLKPEQITVMGDSAGGNLTAALSLMARDKGEFLPKRQILIYPATNSDHSENSPFPSVRENGTGYILTAGKMRDYINLYASCEEDKQNPYFAPILEKDLSEQPDTLILTAEFDPLRDEGEAYGQRLWEAGNKAKVCRIKDALHGYFASGIQYYNVKESFELIKAFLKGE